MTLCNNLSLKGKWAYFRGWIYTTVRLHALIRLYCRSSLARHNCGYIRRIIVVQFMYSPSRAVYHITTCVAPARMNSSPSTGLPIKNHPSVHSIHYVPFHCLGLLQPGSESPCCLNDICNSKGNSLECTKMAQKISVQQSSADTPTIASPRLSG